MVPLELADFAGLDTVLGVMEVLYHNLGDPKPVIAENGSCWFSGA